MSRPRLLDLFCRAGGASVGYAEAGFDVIGVDIYASPDYPYEFVQADALSLRVTAMTGRLIEVGLNGESYWFDAVHASPPCQTFTRAKHLRDAQRGEATALDLLDPIRRWLRPLPVPYVIENVPGAPLYGVQLCGSMFGLAVQRHRIFESNVYIPQPKCDHKTFPIDERSGKPRPIGVYHVLNDEVPKGGKTARTLEEGQQAMGIDWMQWDDLKEAIPPAYTEYVAGFLLDAVREVAS